jgi:hypothetical protein
MSDFSSSTKKDMVEVRSVEGVGGEDCDGWLEVAWVYVLGEASELFRNEVGYGWFAFTL